MKTPGQRQDGIVNLASNWSRTDPDAAISWLLDLPDDEARDFGLATSLSSAVARTGSLDVDVLNSIGDEQTRDRAAMNAIVVLGRSNPDEARRLVEEHINDTNLRQEALQRIAEQRGGTDGTNIFSSSIDIPR